MADESTLQALRKSRGLSLRDVEAITNGKVSNAYLSQLENGIIGNPSLQIALLLAAVYAVSVERIGELLGHERTLPPPACKKCGRPLL